MNAGQPIPAHTIERIRSRLAPTGLNRCQAVAVDTLPDSVWLNGQRPAGLDHDNDETTGAALLLVGHGGRALWDHLHDPSNTEFDFESTPDPVDTFSVRETEDALASELPDVDRRLLYPHDDNPVDLVALGVHLGWQSASPLGLGIGPEYGLWSAFRALWALSAAVEPTPVVEGPDICLTCIVVSCVHACPANAVNVGRRFDLSACSDHRSKPDSDCAETCQSRRACPIAPHHQYDPAQMAYHYRLSRPAVVDDD